MSAPLLTVAVGTAITRRPPHGSVRAALPHTAPTLDTWRQSVHSDMDAECEPRESSGGCERQVPPIQSAGVDRVAVAPETSPESHPCERSPAPPDSLVSHGIGSSLAPPTATISRSPLARRVSASAASAEHPSAWLAVVSPPSCDAP